ncbi:MAG: glycosyltransferase family 4 protein [Ignavibacteriota bacterium]|nr:glycosyltransferase family 4 protein [Ignavibacteriales bacterium]QKJ98218.1 MAG: glycosyltransferase family 4 protein [Ignavibacteriota bacterium]HOJ07520.1 glycosyltransferase family 4 protein [Ignavibacteriaceae bacterium]
MRNKKILMVVYSYFPQDVRPRREAEALINAGYEVDMICLKLPDQNKFEETCGVNTYRVNLSKSRSSRRKYIFLYASFFIRSFFLLNRLFIKNRYAVIHVHNMPDFLVFLSMIPKIFGAKVILDLHDPTPEMLMTKFAEERDSRLTKILKWQEKVSIRFAHKIITTNKSFLDKFISRGCPSDKINIVMNSPQGSIFNNRSNSKEKSDKNKYVVMYHGIIIKRYGFEELLNAVNLLKDKIPGLELRIYGTGEDMSLFLELVQKLNLEKIVKYFGQVPIEKIVEIIPECNVGIIPNRLTPFTKINLPTRIFEYLHLNRPVVVPRTQGIKDYFDESSIFYFNAGDAENLANVIFDVYSNPTKTLDVVNKGNQIYQNYSWELQSKNLIKIYDELLN